MIKTVEFRDLLRDCRVLSSYEDVNGQRRRASTDSLLVLLRSLGVDIRSPDQAGDVLRERRRARLNCGLEPVLVAWDGRLKPVALNLPPEISGGMTFELIAEDGSELAAGRVNVEELKTIIEPDETTYEFVTHKLPVGVKLPMGYHRLHVSVGGKSCQSSVVSAPTQSYSFEEGADHPQRHWCPFLPLYALRTGHDWGAGDFRGLSELAHWAGQLGARAVGTLPLLAASLSEPFEPSPYRPLSRQFWNEFYVDVEAISELRQCEPARQLVASAEFRERIDRQRASDKVGYRELMQLKRQALSLLAVDFFERKPTRFEDFERFLDVHPEVEEYARFRAALDRRGSNWQTWPTQMHGLIPEGEYSPADAIYHSYAQWIAVEQLQSLEKRADAAGAGLYLDLPLGVDPGGYDVWRRPDLYMTAATTGAPPDTMFTGGQDWGLPPMHPERIREDGYQEFRQGLAANMRYARYLRIDHAMGWHRLFVIPQGVEKSQGAYIRYNADEFYAVASLESHRHKCTLLAENLGTVPPAVNRRLDRHRIGGMWILPYELEPSRRQGFNKPPELSVASLNTHDMPPAAAWWRGEDIDDRLDLGLIAEEDAAHEREDRRQITAHLKEQLRAAGSLPLDEETQEVPIAALLRSVAASPAQLMPVNLEDLWLENRPQNVPGTLSERPNWLRKARYSLEEFSRMPEVLDVLDQIHGLRQRIEKPR